MASSEDDSTRIEAEQGRLRLAAVRYIDDQPQISALLNDFVASVLDERPDDVFDFAKSYFTNLRPSRVVVGKRPMVVAGPSGAGKGTIIKRIMDVFPGQLGFCVSHTTRKPRVGEVDGVHYHFISKEEFEQAIRDDVFVEHAHVHSNLYGTSIEAVAAVAEAGLVCLLDIDTQGVRNVKTTNLCPYYVFITPPSMEVLEQRLRNRKTEEEEQLQRRLANAKAEMDYGLADGVFDRVLVNDDLDRAVAEMRDLMLRWYPDLQPAA